MEGNVNRVVVAEDNELVRGGIVALLEEEPNLEVVGQARNGRELLALLGSTECDLLILDLAMPQLDGLSALPEIHALRPGLKVLIYSAHEEPDTFLEALGCGVSGYLLKSEEVSKLTLAVRTICSGRTYYSAKLRDFMRAERAELQRRISANLLSERERELVAMYANGMSAKEMARFLEVSSLQLDRMTGQVMLKLGIKSDAGLREFATKTVRRSPLAVA